MDSEASFWDHVVELSTRLRKALYPFLVITLILLVAPANPTEIFSLSGFYEPLIGLILRRVREQVLSGGIIGIKITGVTLIGLNFSTPLELYFLTSVLFGFVFSLPVIVYEIYKYIDPALYEHERRMIYPFTVAFTALFIAGAVFGYLVIAPFVIWAMIPFFNLVGAKMVINIYDFYSLIFLTVIFTGFSFTMPVIYVLLVRFGVLSTSTVEKNRLYFYVALFVITAAITPDGGPLADLALFLPMLLMMEVAMRIARRYEKERSGGGKEARKIERRCKYCGAIIEEGEVFCPFCGRSQY